MQCINCDGYAAAQGQQETHQQQQQEHTTSSNVWQSQQHAYATVATRAWCVATFVSHNHSKLL